MKLIAIGVLLAAVLQGANAIDVNKMLSLVNAERSKAGKPALALDSCLVQSAQTHSNKQASAKSMSHLLPGEQELTQRINSVCSGRNWMGWAENVAAGQTSEEDCMQGWMNSPGHRANILGDYTHFGAGEGDGSGTKYWTQNFAKGNGQSSGSPSPSPAPGYSPRSDAGQSTPPTSGGSNTGGYTSPSPSPSPSGSYGGRKGHRGRKHNHVHHNKPQHKAY